MDGQFSDVRLTIDTQSDNKTKNYIRYSMASKHHKSQNVYWIECTTEFGYQRTSKGRICMY